MSDGLMDIKAGASSYHQSGFRKKGAGAMPRDSLIVTIVLLVAFVVFAATLAWADHRTRSMRPK